MDKMAWEIRFSNANHVGHKDDAVSPCNDTMEPLQEFMPELRRHGQLCSSFLLDTSKRLYHYPMHSSEFCLQGKRIKQKHAKII